MKQLTEYNVAIVCETAYNAMFLLLNILSKIKTL